MSTMTGYFDVKDSGAYGDGTHDDTSAIQAAESLAEAHGGIVYFPPGTYLVSGTINVAATGVAWRGAGAGASAILSASGTYSPTVVSVTSSSGVNFFSIRDLSFIGNGYATGGANWQVGSPVIAFTGATASRVLNCYFTNNTGVTVDFENGTDAEVAGCNFYAFGYNDGTHFQPAYKTEAVRVGKTTQCKGVRINNNHLVNGKQGGLQAFSDCIDMSHNYGSAIVGSLAFCSSENDNRMAFNSGTGTITIRAENSGSQALDAATSHQFCVIGNNCSYGDSDGIVTNGWHYGIIIGNNVWNNNKQGGDCGIQLDGQDQVQQAVVVIGNNSFDDRVTGATQLIGIRMFNGYGIPDGSDCIVLGNSTNGNVNHGIFQDTNDNAVLFADDTNAVIGNSSWSERIHSAAPVMTNRTSYGSPILSVPIPAGSMMLITGIRVTASGSTSGSNGYKHFQLGFGSSPSNVFTFDSPSKAAGTWQLMAFITNNDSSSQAQSATAILFYNGDVVQTYEKSLTEVTSSALSVMLSVYVDSGSDSITDDYFTVERF